MRLLREGAEKIRQGPFAYLADRLPPAEELALLAADVENKHRETLIKVRKEYTDAGVWLKQMRAPARRAMSPTSEALWRMNGPFVSQCLSRGLSVPHIATLPDADQRLDTIYLSTLGRLPEGPERQGFSASPVSTEPSQIASFFWALLQSTEFQTY